MNAIASLRPLKKDDSWLKMSAFGCRLYDAILTQYLEHPMRGAGTPLSVEVLRLDLQHHTEQNEYLAAKCLSGTTSKADTFATDQIQCPALFELPIIAARQS